MSERRELPLVERAILALSPSWALARARARAAALVFRNYEAASSGRRTEHRSRRGTDANAAAGGQALAVLRAQARDLVRNNPWARRGLRRIASNTVGWGIRPTPSPGRGAARLAELWKRWGETTDCDADGRLTFYGIQRLAMSTVVESGEVLVRRRWRRPSDGLAVPTQLQVLEPDFLDSSRDNTLGVQGGRIIGGVEHDAIGRRVAYWMFDEHPGSGTLTSPVSRRVSADAVAHIFYQERPGQVRGPSWFAPVDVRLADLDEYEDATLMKQKVAACFAAFVTDVEQASLGEEGEDAATGRPTDTIEPGMILNLPPGRSVVTATPPGSEDHPSFVAAALRGVAAGLGTTYEDLTGDYSQLTFSGGRMSRLAHWGDVHDWRWNMLVPQLCAPAWAWMLDALALAGEDVAQGPAEWTAPPAPMLDPDKEGLALSRLVRAGAKTHDEMVREQGYEPEAFWREYKAALDRLDRLGIVLDSDARRTNSAGAAQAAGEPAGAPGAAPAGVNGKANGKANGEAPAEQPG